MRNKFPLEEISKIALRHISSHSYLICLVGRIYMTVALLRLHYVNMSSVLESFKPLSDKQALSVATIYEMISLFHSTAKES
jgi:hypothetical protein